MSTPRRTLFLVLAIALMAVASLVATPTLAASFSINMTEMMDSAADIFNGLWPAFAIVVGLGLGVQILRFIVNAVKAAF
jgi:hypothetical protein